MRLSYFAAVLSLVLASQSMGTLAELPDVEPRPWDPPKGFRKLLEASEGVYNEETLRSFEKRVAEALEENPASLDLHRLYIGAAGRGPDAESVAASYRKRAEAEPANPDAQFLLGMVTGGVDGLEPLRKALELDPDHYYAHCALGLGLVTTQVGTREEGMEHLFKALRMKPDHPYAYQGLAVAYAFAYKDAETALEVCRRWMKVEPTAAQPTRMEAGILHQLGRTEESHASQIRAAELAKTNPEDAYRAAIAFATKGDKKEAMRWVDEAARRGYADARTAQAEPAFAAVKEEASFARAVRTMEENRSGSRELRRSKILERMEERPAPTFQVRTLSGREVSLESLSGKVVVLDFWATWCRPCRITLPLVKRLEEQMKGRPVEILCMNVWERDPERARVVPYWKENDYTMEVGLAANDDAMRFGVTGIPALFVLDQRGRIRYQHTGHSLYMDEEVGWVIESLLAESE